MVREPESSTTPTNLLAPFIRTWVLTEVAQLLQQPFLAPSAWWFAAMLALLLASAVLATGDVFKVTLAWRLAGHWACAPYAFESAQWSVYADIALLLAILLAQDDNDAVCAAAPAVRACFGIFYFAAGWWKINSSFLDRSSSCAPILMLQLIAAYVPASLTPASLPVLAARIAAPMTIVGEMVIGLLLLVPSTVPGGRLAHALAVGLTTLLHTAISATPFPNQIASFSCVSLLRVAWASLPAGWALAVGEAASWPSRTDARALAARAGTVATLAAAAALNTVPGMALNLALILYAALALLAGRSLALEPPLASYARLAPADTPATATARRRAAAVARCVLVPCALYALAWPCLGLTDLGLAGPFSSLRVHGGSNHLVVPTGLLQARAAARGEAGGAFGGGVVRVSACTSQYIRDVTHPDCSAALPARARELLHQAGHTAVQHNPTVARIIPEARVVPQGFVPFTVPALELRRLLAEARERGERFSLTYDVLPGATGGREWRTGPGVRTVRVQEDGAGGRECKVLRGPRRGRCAPDEIAEQPPPSGWVGKALIFFAHPVDSSDELPCMD